MKKALHIAKRILFITAVAACCAGFTFLMVSAVEKQHGLRCRALQIDVDYHSGNSFITEKEIEQRITFLCGRSPVGRILSHIDIPTLENDLRKNPFVADAQVFVSQNQTMKVRIVQKNALLRVINTTGVSYYIATDGRSMPLSNSFTPTVPIVFAHLPYASASQQDSLLRSALFQIGTFIKNDTLLSALVDQVWVNDRNEFELYTCFKGHTVLLGDHRQLSDKFNRLKIFYREAMTRTGWQRYGRINVKFANQVIAEKKPALNQSL